MPTVDRRGHVRRRADSGGKSVNVESSPGAKHPVINARDLYGYLNNQQLDVEFVLPGGITLRGRVEVGQFTQAMWSAFPDGRLAFRQQILPHDAAATEVVFTGTHTGPMNTPNGLIPPTGKRLILHSLSILRIEDGRVASEHVYFDQLEMMSQLGLAPAPTSIG
jgi:predicted ester cyclase